MVDYDGIVEEPLLVDAEVSLTGIARRDVTVTSEGFLILDGITGGDLVVAAGGTAIVDGIVDGDIRNAGRVRVLGKVRGRVTTLVGGETTIEPGSVIGGVTQ
jgi:hypothetical protein